MQKKLVGLMIFLFCFSFLITSFSLITYTVNKDNTYYVDIPQQATKINYNVPIGHYLPFNWTTALIGSSPINFAQKTVGLNCQLVVDKLFDLGHVLRYKDMSYTDQIVTRKGLLNQTSYSGCIDFIFYSYSFLAEMQGLSIIIFNSSLFIGQICNVFVGSIDPYTIDVGICYSGGYQTYHYHNLHVLYLSLSWSFLTNTQNIVGMFENLTVAFSYTCGLNMVWSPNLYASSQWLQISTTTTYICDLWLLGIDSSNNFGFTRFRSFNFTVLPTYGYYSSILYSISLLSIVHNYINPRIYSGNITFSISSTQKDYIWFAITLDQILLTTDYMWEIPYFMLLYSDLTVILSYFDKSDSDEQTIEIQVRLTINYDFIEDSLFQLYLSASIPIALISLLPIVGYKITHKRKQVYWFSLFATILTVIFWKGIFLSLGGIIAIASILIILIDKYREEK